MPPTLPKLAAISWAICWGARFRRLASSKQRGEAASPIAILGGRSSTMASSAPYLSLMGTARAQRRRLVSVRYTRRAAPFLVEEAAQYKDAFETGQGTSV